MKQYLLAVGGTGNKILEGVVWAAAAGVLDPGGELRMLSVDVDASCGNTTRAMQSCAHYEAVRELLCWCFIERGAARVWCGHSPGNDKSRRVIEKCGFTYVCDGPSVLWPDGQERPTCYYAIAREDWEKEARHG